MPRTLLVAVTASLAALLLLVPATGVSSSSSSAKLRGTVAATFPDNHLVRVDSRRFAHILRVPGSQARIHVGMRVELRGTTLRRHGNGSRVLARNVQVFRSVRVGSPTPVTGGSLAPKDDDELEVKGTLTSLSPLTVTNSAGSAVCAVPAGVSLAGFAVGNLVEITCDLRAGIWTLRKLKHEDDDEIRGDDDDEEEDDDNSGPGSCDDDDDDDHSGSGDCDDDDDDDDDNSGHGNGDDDDDDDSGRGNGDDDED